MKKAYKERFVTPEDVTDYESREYHAASYSSRMWELQMPVLRKLLEGHRNQHGRLRLLDFACGTGRVLSFEESLVDESYGIDISPQMAQAARAKCVRSEIRIGDICANPDLVPGKFQVVSALRFLLNAEPALREAALNRLRGCLDERSGILITNMHGNSHSLRHYSLIYRRWQRRRNPTKFPESYMLEEMSPAETANLLRRCGFEIIQQIGFGLLPRFMHESPLRQLAWLIDRAVAGAHWTQNCSIDVFYVCRVKPGLSEQQPA